MATQTKWSPLQSLHTALQKARSNTDCLFDVVREDSLYERPIPERHRIIFYIGHLEAFDWNLLREHLFSLPSHTPEFDKLFAFGIDPVDGGLPTDQPEDWPSLGKVRQYVQSLRAQIDEALHAGRFLGAGGYSPETVQQVAVEHRLMHAETLAYMFHQMPHGKKIAQPQLAAADSSPMENLLVEIPAGRATLGQARNAGTNFGWDNEFEAIPVSVPGFRIQKYMVTNGEYLRFMEADGYNRAELWSAADWEWKEHNAISHPAFWKKSGATWFYRGMFEDIVLPETWPVYVSHAEASAYARWSGYSLPSEAQWHRAAYGTPQGDERLYSWGSAAANPALGNFDFARWDPLPVHAYPASQSAFGVEGLLGNGWEWTSTPFGPFPGFQPFAFYPGYSANFFDNKHFVIKGGSSRTAACLLRRSFRNWFQPHYQYVYAGFRCVCE
jgi:iron(II)-dependent oxidoreductase